MKPLITIARPVFMDRDDELEFKSKLEDMRRDGYHVIGWTTMTQDKPVVRVYGTKWFSQLLEFLRDRFHQKEWNKTMRYKGDKARLKREIKRLQDLALQHGATPHEVHSSDVARQLVRRGIIAAIALSIMASCAPRAVGFRNHPLPPAYVARKATIGVGKIVVMDLQIIKR